MGEGVIMPYDLLEDEIPGTGLSDEGALGWAARNLIRGGKEVLKNTVSSPFDTAAGIGNVLNLVEENIPSLPGSSSASSENSKRIPTEKVPFTSEKLEALIDNPYLKPKTENEQLFDDTISDIVSLLNPIKTVKNLAKGKLPGAKLVKRAIKSGVAGKTAEWLTKSFTDNPIIQTGVKVGTQLLTALGGTKALATEANELYDAFDKTVKPGELISSAPITNITNPLSSLLKKGGTTPSKDFLKNA